MLFQMVEDLLVIALVMLEHARKVVALPRVARLAIRSHFVSVFAWSALLRVAFEWLVCLVRAVRANGILYIGYPTMQLELTCRANGHTLTVSSLRGLLGFLLVGSARC
jgi:hypothetical protein